MMTYVGSQSVQTQNIGHINHFHRLQLLSEEDTKVNWKTTKSVPVHKVLEKVVADEVIKYMK